ncbi:MAG: hypothetical protein M3O74_06860 [Pseudomonadota bacterium]|nr:hypothetical protein [Pseudomonadota bacterium]
MIDLTYDPKKPGALTHASKMIFLLGKEWAKLKKIEVDETEILPVILMPAWSAPNGTDPELLMAAFEQYETATKKFDVDAFAEDCFRLVAAHLFRSMEKQGLGATDEAWQHATNATWWLAFATGISINGPNDRWKMIQEKMQTARHRENNEIRDQAYVWLNANFDALKLTNDDAAEKLGEVVPVKLSTRIDYVKSWKKTRQSPQK